MTRKLAVNKQDYEDLFFRSPLPMLVYDAATYKFLKVNEAAIRHYGYTREELQDLTVGDLYRKREASQLFINGKLIQGNFTHLKKSGEVLYVKVRSTDVVLEGREAVLLVVNDVTDSRISEMELIKVNKQLKAAQQISKLGYWVYYFRENKSEWFEEMYGIWEMDQGSASPAFEDFLKTIHPEDSYLFSGLLKDISDHPLELEHRILTLKGKEKWVFQRLNLVRDDDNLPVRLEGVAQDITEQKKLENEREAILESITDGFFAVDKNWTIIYWNKAAEEILQVRKEKILYKNLWDVSEEFIKFKSYQEYDQALKNQEVRVFEEHFPALDIWVEISAFPRMNGLSVYVRDISERKQHQRAIFRTIQETQEKERARFGRDMHDGLTQSLTAIKMNLIHLKDKMDPSDQGMKIVERTLEYTNNSIQESRSISHGLLSVTLENYGLARALEELVTNVNAGSGIEMVFEDHLSGSAQLPKELEINIYRIAQEAVNNIVKHSHATDGKIILIADAESVQLIINDNGIGIKELKKNAFQKGAGLKNIEVRVEGFDGRYTLLHRPRGGLQLHVVFSKLTS